MHDQDVPLLPACLPLLRTQLSYRFRESARLPAYKGGMLRGGFGYAFQRAACPQSCWGAAQNCPQPVICPYRWVFETPHPPAVSALHDLRDVPRPFVIDLPDDQHTTYAAGAALTFGLTLIGRGIDFLPYFLFGFAQLGSLGLGAQRARAELAEVRALAPGQADGPLIYAAGQVLAAATVPPMLDAARIAAQAQALPADLRIELVTPLRIKTRGSLLDRFDLPALMQAVCWRLRAIATFHGDAPWPFDYRPMVAAARAVCVTDVQVRWVEWERHSDHQRRAQRIQLGGLVGQARLHNVPLAVRTILLAGSVIHAGKACVFGHGAYRLHANDALAAGTPTGADAPVS